MASPGYELNEIRDAIKRLVADITERAPEEISDTALFQEDLGIDSLLAMELMINMDKKYKIDIPEEEFQKIKNVEDAVAAVQRHLS
jgi:acyl carrier protein